MTTTRDQICSAVRERKFVKFFYDGFNRTIEPHVVYSDSDGEWYIEGWQTAGYTSRPNSDQWRRYKVADIRSLEILDEKFTGVRPPYERESERYDSAWCKL